jgi:hypothetical protein
MNVNYPEEAVWKLADGKLAQLVTDTETGLTRDTSPDVY